MSSQSYAFWTAINNIHAHHLTTAEAKEAFRLNPVKFLRDSGIDPEIRLGNKASQKLSDYLEHATPQEREAIAASLFSLSDAYVAASAGRAKTLDDSNDDDMLILPNVNIFINANIVENANANANANINQLANLNANQYENANANNNTNGLGLLQGGEQAGGRSANSNLARHSMEVRLPSDFQECEVSKQLSGLKLNLARQKSLIKRALLDTEEGFGDNVDNGATCDMVYSYRKLSFRIRAGVEGHKIVVSDIRPS